MLNLKDRDILLYLDGSASKQEVDAVTEWVEQSADNAQSLVEFEKLHREIDLLKSYNPVNVEAEWNSFQSLISDHSTKTELEIESNQIDSSIESEDIDDIDVASRDLVLLQYLDRTISAKDELELDKFLATDSEGNSSLNLSRRILAESPYLESYRAVDLDAEWNSFKSKVSVGSVVRGATTELNQPSVKRSGTVVPLWMRYAAAACLTLLLAALIWFVLPKDNYTSYSTGDQSYAFTMVDGSLIELDKNTTLRYPKSIKNVNERRLYLKGEGKFDVAKIKDKPFTVESTEGIGVNVLGTIFKVYAQEGFLKAVENIEGKVRAYSISNPEIYVDMKPGDRYGWDGSGFVDINKPKEIDNSKEYQILYVLDFLMKNSSWKVISSPNMPFDEEGVVKIDLEKPVQDILNDLKERADFDYVPLDCESCFRITKFSQTYQ